MSDSCRTKMVLMEVQENGIIRRASDGYLVGRINDDISFDSLEEFEKGTVLIQDEAGQRAENFLLQVTTDGSAASPEGVLNMVDEIDGVTSVNMIKVPDWCEDDEPLPEDDQIEAAHPLRTDDHETYMEAFRMVCAKRSKFALVDLVNWLLRRIKEKT